jgi:acyl carrier protein
MAKTLDAEKTIVEMIACQGLIDESDVTPNANLVDDCNLDSLDLIELCITLEESFDFDFQIDPQAADNWKTVQDVLDYINDKTGAKK